MSNTCQTRIDRVLGHIRGNLAADLSLDCLADVAALSRFHFHRTFAAMTGETVAEAVRRARLNRAAVLLVTTRDPVDRIARMVGYPNPQSFARAYRAAFHQTPSRQRRAGILPDPLLPQNPGELAMYPVEIRTLPATRIAAIPHSGPYPQIGATFAALWQKLQATGLAAQITGPGIALYYDDPASIPAADLRSHAGVTVAAGAPLPPGFDELILPAGRAAVLTYKGPYSGLREPWSYLYGPWLGGSGALPGDLPPYERYLNDAMTTPPDELLTEIILPLR